MFQFRNYCLTINNEPRTDEVLFEYCKQLNNIKYFVFQREKGSQEGTEHIQMYLEFNIPKRFETIKEYFPRAHIEERKGSKSDARDYCMKSDTRLNEPMEYGNFVDNGKRSDLADIYELVKDGATNYEIMEMYPTQFMRYSKAIEQCRRVYIQEKFKNKFRDNLEVYYIWGPTRSGKSRYVVDKYGYENIFRVTDYEKGPFDKYEFQDVLVLEEFRSSFRIELLLNVLDKHPFDLPCRYDNKTACYTKVYIISNISLKEQYKNIQREQYGTWLALLERINLVYYFDNREDKESIIGISPKELEKPIQNTIYELVPVDDESLPF